MPAAPSAPRPAIAVAAAAVIAAWESRRLTRRRVYRNPAHVAVARSASSIWRSIRFEVMVASLAAVPFAVGGRSRRRGAPLPAVASLGPARRPRGPCPEPGGCSTAASGPRCGGPQPQRRARGSAPLAARPDVSPAPASAAPSTAARRHFAIDSLPGALDREAHAIWSWAPGGVFLTRLFALVDPPPGSAGGDRTLAGPAPATVRADAGGDLSHRPASAEAVVSMFEALHKRLLRRWWRRLLLGQPSVALEVHHAGAGSSERWLAVACPVGLEGMVEAALRTCLPELPAGGRAAAARAAPGGAAAEEARRVHQAREGRSTASSTSASPR